MIDTSALDSAGMGSLVPAESSSELERIRRRFTELSIEAAENGMRRARALLDLLSDRLAQPTIPDLGPATVPDQLAVLVFDAYRVGLADGVAELLTQLRRELP